jgi:metallo-beta-lactamase family protein
MKITFLGATDTVTGSRYLIENGGARLLVDCGLFQGSRSIRERNWQAFPVKPSSIDAVLLTHAHIDHSGYLPALVKRGFRGKVFCTSGTKSLCEILLPDSARLQEEEADYRNRHGATRFHPALPLYSVQDANRSLELFSTQRMGKPFMPVPRLTATFSYAGHILGSACIRISDGDHAITFSGDVGRLDDLLMRPPEPLEATDYLVLESTYGDRRHGATDPAQELEDIVRKTVKRGGIIVIPAFAVGRTQLILYLLTQAITAGRIPDLPIFLDSPMAIDATELFCHYTGEHRLDIGGCRAMSKRVTYTHTVDESKAIRSQEGPKIIVSASGMATGGRVLHHLRNYLPDPRNTVIIVGYQAEGTRGAALERGARHVHILGQDIPVQAQIFSLDGLSAHADYQELTDWISSLPEPPITTYLVHGEPESRDIFKSHLEQTLGWDIKLPDFGETCELSSK